MKKGKKSFIEKLRPELEPRVTLDPRTGGRMLIPTPLLVSGILRDVPRGRLITLTTIRERLAARHGADLTCPLTTGIFLGIVAGAAEEKAASGESDLVPYWRVVKDNGALLPKLPPGEARQAERLMAEGHTLKPGRGKGPARVEDFEQHLVL